MIIPAGATGVDFSGARPDPKLLADRGDRFVCRYLTGAWKKASRTELQGYWDHGIAVVLNGETAADAALLGALRGSIDALAFVASARQLGAPAGTCIVCSHDTSAWSDQVPLYFRAAYDVIIAAGYTFGVYGSGKVVQDCIDRGMVLTIIWATNAILWPGGRHQASHIHQGAQITIPGGPVDLNVCKRPFEAWHPNSTKPPKPPVPPVPPVVVVTPPHIDTKDDDDMMRILFTTDNAGIWLLHDGTLTHISEPQHQGLLRAGVQVVNPDPKDWLTADELAGLQALFP